MQDLEWRAERLVWESLPDDPMKLFEAWHTLAALSEPWHGGAMLLATATCEGAPSARIVLMRGFGEYGIRFFTNYESRKGQVLESNPQAAAVFWWPSQVRQVRVEGLVVRLPVSESAAYFSGRPRGSQIGAWSSPQSQSIEDLDVLRDVYAVRSREFEGTDVPCPPFWGGYLLQPQHIEFWQGGQDRLHDRILYSRQGEAWDKKRLAP
jgi:pyridoxamine 5'-phosphate oxidase